MTCISSCFVLLRKTEVKLSHGLQAALICLLKHNVNDNNPASQKLPASDSEEHVITKYLHNPQNKNLYLQLYIQRYSLCIMSHGKL